MMLLNYIFLDVGFAYLINIAFVFLFHIFHPCCFRKLRKIMFPHFVETMDPLARDEGTENIVQDIILQGNNEDVITSYLNNSGEGAEDELYRTLEDSGADNTDGSDDNRDGSGADGSGARPIES